MFFCHVYKLAEGITDEDDRRGRELSIPFLSPTHYDGTVLVTMCSQVSMVVRVIYKHVQRTEIVFLTTLVFPPLPSLVYFYTKHLRDFIFTIS